MKEKTKVKSLLCLILILSLFFTGQSQSGKKIKYEPFGAGAIVGINLSQLDGDFFTGFDKVGWYAGVRGIVNLSYRSSANMELLYSQKGSKIPHGNTLDPGQEIRDRLIALDYVEVPIIFKYNLNPKPNGIFIEIGASFARLINTTIEEKDPRNIRGTVYQNITEDFRSTDLNIIGGLGIDIGKLFEVNARLTHAVNKFYVNENYVRPAPFSMMPEEIQFLKNYHFSLMMVYNIL